MDEETVWRITEDDFREVIEQYYPDLDKQQIKYLIEIAHHKFSVYDWITSVQVFIDCHI